MNCGHARELFGAYWDDEITQAEREWLESHFTSCEGCRVAYEEFSRPLEALATLPRIEAENGFADRVLARVRHAGSAPDRLPRPVTPAWVPVTAAAALLLLAGTYVAPWLATRNRAPGETSTLATRHVPVDVQLVGGAPREAVPVPNAPAPPTTVQSSDSLFDHSADVEFILDPVTLRRGQATVSRQAPGTAGERSVVSF
jgi:anti-sigma factor RsiW